MTLLNALKINNEGLLHDKAFYFIDNENNDLIFCSYDGFFRQFTLAHISGNSNDDYISQPMSWRRLLNDFYTDIKIVNIEIRVLDND